MDLQARKMEFLKEFLKLEDEKSVLRLEEVLKEEQQEGGNPEFQPMSLEEFYSDIEEALRDSEAGRVISTEDLLKEIKEWY